MKSTNFLIATIDKDFNMFKLTEEQPQFIEKIAEHIKRLEEISEGHHFYIDDVAFKALGESNFPLRFTRVFSKNPDVLKRSVEYRCHNINELSATISSKDKFSPNVQIFFIGSSEFLMEASKYAKKLLLTVVDRSYTDKLNVIDKFPLNEMKTIFKRRKSIHPELLENIKLYKEMKAKSMPKKETIIAENGMKIIQDIPTPEFDASDEILNTPDYMFYEYRK